MSRIARAAILAALTLAASASPLLAVSFKGVYRSSQNPGAFINVTELRGVSAAAYIVRGKGWEALGYGDDSTFVGVIREMAPPGRAWATGTLQIRRETPNRLFAQAVFSDGTLGFQDIWNARDPVDSTAPVPPADPSHRLERPKWGEYVYVEELPVAIHKTAPVYPEIAREAQVQGKVVVAALVLEDGSVADTRIRVSVPMLDASAQAAVRKYQFKPALLKGAPVAVWVDVPVSFKLP